MKEIIATKTFKVWVKGNEFENMQAFGSIPNLDTIWEVECFVEKEYVNYSGTQICKSYLKIKDFKCIQNAVEILPKEAMSHDFFRRWKGNGIVVETEDLILDKELHDFLSERNIIVTQSEFDNLIQKSHTK